MSVERKLAMVVTAARRSAEARELLEQRIVEARAEGASLRAIAEAAGLSNPGVLGLLRRRGAK